MISGQVSRVMQLPRVCGSPEHIYPLEVSLWNLTENILPIFMVVCSSFYPTMRHPDVPFFSLRFLIS
jgi:hypothetical protein